MGKVDWEKSLQEAREARKESDASYLASLKSFNRATQAQQKLIEEVAGQDEYLETISALQEIAALLTNPQLK